MEECHTEVKDKTGDVCNANSILRVNKGGGGKGDIGGRGDSRSRSSIEGKLGWKVNAALRRPPRPSQPKVARPALKTAVEGERGGASIMGRQSPRHQGYNPFWDVLDMLDILGRLIWNMLGCRCIQKLYS